MMSTKAKSAKQDRRRRVSSHKFRIVCLLLRPLDFSVCGSIFDLFRLRSQLHIFSSGNL
jgi:hypothetical protein